MKYDLYKQFLEEQSQNYNKNFPSKTNISSDFSLILNLIKEIIFFIILFIPYLFLGTINLLLGNSQRSKYYFNKIFIEPFKLISSVLDWFFQAKITSTLIIILITSFFIQVFYLNSQEILINSLKSYTSHIFEGNYYSSFTSIFLHGDLVHLLTNCLALLVFGRIVERQFKNLTLLIFLGSGIISNILSNSISYLLNDYYYSLGASGAIAGLIIFAILLEPFAMSTLFIVPLPIFLIGWFIILMDLIGLTNPSQVNHLAHISGYSALLVLFFFLEIKHRKKIVLGFSINLVLLLIIYVLSKIIDLKSIFSNLL